MRAFPFAQVPPTCCGRALLTFVRTQVLALLFVIAYGVVLLCVKGELVFKWAAAALASSDALSPWPSLRQTASVLADGRRPS